MCVADQCLLFLVATVVVLCRDLSQKAPTTGTSAAPEKSKNIKVGVHQR